MPTLYSIEVTLCATVYIQAESEEAARELLYENYGRSKYDPKAISTEEVVSGQHFEDPDLPEISLSPIMTAYGPFSDGKEVFEIVAELPDE